MNLPLNMVFENGKKITVEKVGGRIALIVWRKNNSPLLPLVLSETEGRGLRTLLEATLAKIAEKRG